MFIDVSEEPAALCEHWDYKRTIGSGYLVAQVLVLCKKKVCSIRLL
jgi:hypothetical protein